MNCPNCNVDIIEDSFTCDNCGVDVVLFYRITELSNYHYNVALNFANKRNITNAIEALLKSLYYNKNNYQARNLLGLIYFEVGRVGDAIKQWIVSQSVFEDTENLAYYYLDIIENSAEELDKLNNSISTFNQALVSIQQKNVDVAIIHLKKALELNPTFVDAMNLLSFCYCIQKNREQAISIAEAVLKIDVANPVALNYYKELTGRARMVRKETKLATTPTPADKENFKTLFPAPEPEKKSIANNIYFGSVLSFISGAICAMALFFILILPNNMAILQEELVSLQTTYDTAKTRWITDEESLTDQLNSLELANTNLTDEISNLTSQLTVIEREAKLSEISRLINSENYVDAAYAINILDTTGFEQSALSEIEKYKEQSYPIACDALITQGIDYIGAKSFSDATETLELAFLYSKEAVSLQDDAIYYLGRSAEGAGEFGTAINYYETVINDYPDSNIIESAKRQLNGLTSD